MNKLDEIAILEEQARAATEAIGDKCAVALAQLADKLEVAKRAAFAEGLDFAIGPIAPESEDMFEVRNIFAPQKMTIGCKAGAVDRSFEPPPGWIVHRNPDYADPSVAVSECDLGRGQEP